jgi:hypothetical protein
MEDHMHQLEELFGFVDNDLFWNKFVGFFPGGGRYVNPEINNPRCGWAHFPPNGEKDYDWANQIYVKTDCENWDPDSLGELTEMNCSRWNCRSLDFFIWWMQNIPGDSNTLSYNKRPLRNWWEFVADFDAAMARGRRLTN